MDPRDERFFEGLKAKEHQAVRQARKAHDTLMDDLGGSGASTPDSVTSERHTRWPEPPGQPRERRPKLRVFTRSGLGHTLMSEAFGATRGSMTDRSNLSSAGSNLSR